MGQQDNLALTVAMLELQKAKLQRQVIDLMNACGVGIDALGCDRMRLDRLRAQEIMHKAVNGVRNDPV